MGRRWTPETVLAKAIAADPAVVERLAAFHPEFKRLRNPLRRKVMARLVTFADAARVAGVPVSDLLAAARGEALPADDAGVERGGGDTDEAPRPAWMEMVDEAAAVRLDVRPLLAAGEEPLGLLLRTAAEVGEGGAMIVEAPFDPAPLRRVLAGKGFVSHGERVAEGHWRITFRRENGAGKAGESDKVEKVPDEAAEEREGRVWRAADGVHIDVRGMEPPGPMRAILELLERPDTGSTVTVHHEREPLFLYPELDERGWRHAIVPGEPGEVRLRLTRGEAP